MAASVIRKQYFPQVKQEKESAKLFITKWQLGCLAWP